MSVFDKKRTYTAKAKEFTATMKPTATGAWHAVVKLGDGTTRGITYASEADMMKGLQAMSKYLVEFVRVVEDPLGLNSQLAAAKQNMLDANEGRRGRGEVREIPVAPSKTVQFSEEDLSIMEESIFAAFKTAHAAIFNSNSYNDPLIRRAIKDCECLITVENYRIVCEWLLSENMLVPVGGLKRGQSISPYKSPQRIVSEDTAEERAEVMGRIRQLRALPISDPNSLPTIRDAVKAEYPHLDIGGRKSYTESTSARGSERSKEETEARAKSFEQLQLEEKQRQREVAARKPRVYTY
jgi:hypothetical protein